VPLTDIDTVTRWLAGAQLAFGSVCLVMGLRARGRPGEVFAPVGAMAIVTGLSHFLWGTVPDAVLITVDLVATVALTVWFVRGYRASRARTRELLKQRDASQSWR
jgi:hypothetical protein